MSTPTHQGYEDYDTIRDPEGIVGIISRRIAHNTFSVALFRVYERDGQEERTLFFGRKHFAAARRVLDLAEARIAKLEAEATPTSSRRPSSSRAPTSSR